MPDTYRGEIPADDRDRSRYVSKRINAAHELLAEGERRADLQYVVAIYDPITKRFATANSRHLDGVWGDTSAEDWIPSLYAHNMYLEQMQLVMLGGSAHEWQPLPCEEIPGGRDVVEAVVSVLVSLINPGALSTKDRPALNDMRCVGIVLS